MPLGLAIALGAGALVGGIAGGKANANAQDRANAINYRMNQENNALQRELANQKYDKDLEQWHRQNAYNSPLAQAQRYQQAGINPYLADIDGGQATSSPEMSLAQTQAGHVEPVSKGYVGDSLVNAVNMFGSTYYTLEQAKQTSINNKTLATKNLLDIAETRSRLKSAKLTREFDRLQMSWYSDLKRSEIGLNNANAGLAEMKAIESSVDTMIKRQELSFLPERQRLERAKSIADTALSVAQGKLTLRQAETEVKKMQYMDSQIALNYASADNQRAQTMATDWNTLSSQEKHGSYVQLLKEEVRKMGYEADKAHWQSYPTTDEFWNGHDWTLFKDKRTRDDAWEIYKARRGLKIGGQIRQILW